MRCANCGYEMVPGQSRCFQCDTGLGTAATESIDAAPPKQKPFAVGGWLVVFCIAVGVVFPLTALLGIEAAWDGPASSHLSFELLVLNGIVFGGMALYSMITAGMVWVGAGDIKKVAQRYLLVRLAVSTMGGFILLAMAASQLPSAVGPIVMTVFAFDVIRELIFFTIWYAYFQKSKRVAAASLASPQTQPV